MKAVRFSETSEIILHRHAVAYQKTLARYLPTKKQGATKKEENAGKSLLQLRASICCVTLSVDCVKKI